MDKPPLVAMICFFAFQSHMRPLKIHATNSRVLHSCRPSRTAEIIFTSENHEMLHTLPTNDNLSCGNISSFYNSMLPYELNQMCTKTEQQISKPTLTYYWWERVKQANLLWSGPTWVYLYSPWIFSFWKYWFRRALAFSKVQFPWSPAFKSTSSDSSVCWINEN